MAAACSLVRSRSRKAKPPQATCTSLRSSSLRVRAMDAVPRAGVQARLVHGPRPGGAHPRAPVVEQVAEALLQRDAGSQPVSALRRAGSPTCAGTSEGRRRSLSTRISTATWARARSASSRSRILQPRPLQTLKTPPRDLRRAIEQGPVGAHHVAHVGVVAHRLEVAHEEHRLAQARPRSRRSGGRTSSRRRPRPGRVRCGGRCGCARRAGPGRGRTRRPAGPARSCWPRRARRAAGGRPRAGAGRRGPRRRTPRRSPPPGGRGRGARRRSASTRWTRPRTLVRRVPPGSSQDTCTLDWPARWTMRSGATGSSTGSRAAGSLRSASSSAEPRGGSRACSAVGPGEAEELGRRVLAPEEVHEVGAHEASHPGDEDLHRGAPGAPGVTLGMRIKRRAYHTLRTSLLLLRPGRCTDGRGRRRPGGPPGRRCPGSCRCRPRPRAGRRSATGAPPAS